ncbi:MAG TPA: tetratricopeptide repeat protein [Terriglobia bacterium]|nr:tetratricopeptide repeat protein [Terriglobia bacterium]
MGVKRRRRRRVTRHGWGMILGISLLTMGAGLTAGVAAQTQSSVEQLFEQAQAARAQGDLNRAAQAYLEVIRRDPGFVNAYQNLGIVYLSQKRYPEAITTLEKAIRLNPRLPGAYVILGLAHYELYQSHQAVTAFQHATRLNPNDTNAIFFLGKAQMQSGNYRDAAATFEKLRQSRPKDPDVLYNLGLAHLKLLTAAEDGLREIAPQPYQLALLEAQHAADYSNDAAAIQYFQEALRLKPDAVGIHYGLGSAYARASKFEEAAQEFKEELRINPNDSLALWRLGEITLHQNPTEAVQYLRQAVSLNPGLPQAVLAYGRALLRTGETEKSIEQFQRVVKLAPEEDSVHYLLANAYRKLGRQAESIAEMDRFQQMARMTSAQHEATARELATSFSQKEGEPLDLEPGFSSSRYPIHP